MPWHSSSTSLPSLTKAGWQEQEGKAGTSPTAIPFPADCHSAAVGITVLNRSNRRLSAGTTTCINPITFHDWFALAVVFCCFQPSPTPSPEGPEPPGTCRSPRSAALTVHVAVTGSVYMVLRWESGVVIANHRFYCDVPVKRTIPLQRFVRYKQNKDRIPARLCSVFAGSGSFGVYKEEYTASSIPHDARTGLECVSLSCPPWQWPYGGVRALLLVRFSASRRTWTARMN